MVVRIIGAGAVGAVVAEKLSHVADTAFIIDEGRKERYESGIMLNGRVLDIPCLTPSSASYADLVIFGSGCNLVVDYKTDSFMDEAEHLGQITAYARAMEDLYGKKCLAVLLYVRGWRRGTPVDSSGNPFRGTLPL